MSLNSESELNILNRYRFFFIADYRFQQIIKPVTGFSRFFWFVSNRQRFEAGY